MIKRKEIWTLLFVLLLLFGITSGVLGQYAVGDTVVDFTLQSVNGEDVSLSDYQGQTKLVYFFTTT